MKEGTKSLIRHILTAVGMIIALTGLNEWTGLLDILTGNLDGVYAGIAVVGGLITAVGGFFKDRKRHKDREVGANGN